MSNLISHPGVIKTSKVLRMRKAVVGTVVRISKDAEFFKKKQTEHHLTTDPVYCGCAGIVRQFTTAGDAAINIRISPGRSEKIVICHPATLSVCSRGIMAFNKIVSSLNCAFVDGYEGTDEDGVVIKAGDAVKILADYDTVKELQKGHGDMTNDHKACLGKFGQILCFDVDGDTNVIVAEDTNCFNPKAVRKVTSGIV